MAPLGILPFIAAAKSTPYKIEQSLRFNSADSAYLNRTPGSAGNRKTWTWSGWVKLGSLSSTRPLFAAYIGSGSTDNQFFSLFIENGLLRASGYSTAYLTSTAVHRDPSAWYHIVCAVDTTNATADNRIRFYVNGTELTAFNTRNNPSLNAGLGINQAAQHQIGQNGGFGSYFDGYLAEVNFIDGSALDPTYFGKTNDQGVWVPLRYGGSYTGQSWYLKFADGDGTDDSGLSNDWTANNFTTSGTGTDVMSDTPTTNWCTLNPLDAGTSGMLSDGNLIFNLGSGSDYIVRTTQGMSSGKWYAEWTYNSGVNSYVGIASYAASLSGYLGQDQYGYAYDHAGNKYNNNSGTSYGATYTHGDVIGIAFDADAGSLTFYKNGTSQGTAFTGLSNFPYFFAHGANNCNGTFNFGQRDFEYTPPTGYKALNTSNLPAPEIKDGSEYFNTVLWTGNSTDDRDITGVGFKPDFTWLKERGGTNQHELYDAVRGATKRLQTNDTAAEDTVANNLQAFNSDGFQVGTAGSVNNSSDTYVAWNWLAGGSTSSNTDGSVTSTVSANPSAGFSIVRWSNQGTVGHGLGVAPSFIIVKSINKTSGWWVYSTALGNSNYGLPLHSTAAQTTTINWGGAPTSTVFYISSGNGALPATSDNIAYCFAEVEGFSKIGGYTGNGSTDGTFVYCGFRPAWVMIRRSNSTGNWVIQDSARGGYNPDLGWLYANDSSLEDTGSSRYFDFLSNGFKIRNSGTNTNTSGAPYIFIALAENPFGGSGVSPATAR